MVEVAVTLQAAFNTFVLALITGLAAVIVTSVVRLLRRLRDTDRHVRSLRQRQRLLMRWAQRAGRQIDLQFPLEDSPLDEDPEE